MSTFFPASWWTRLTAVIAAMTVGMLSWLFVLKLPIDPLVYFVLGSLPPLATAVGALVVGRRLESEE